jgi:hypothetical protein
MEVRGQLHPPAASPPGKEPLVPHWIGDWVGPRAVLDAVVKRKIPNSRRESNPRTPIVQPVTQRYTDWAITALGGNWSIHTDTRRPSGESSLCCPKTGQGDNSGWSEAVTASTIDHAHCCLTSKNLSLITSVPDYRDRDRFLLRIDVADCPMKFYCI